MYEFQFSLDPVTQTGLSLAVQLLVPGRLVMTVALTESPAGIYFNPGDIIGLAAGSYLARLVNTADGSQVNLEGDATFDWNGTAEVEGALPTIAAPVGRSYFAGTSDADVIAATIPAALIPAYLALNDPTDKLALLVHASYDIDHAMRYQGRRYDTITQAVEFPRVAYEPSNAILPNTGAAGIPGGSAFGSTIWDVDPITLAIQVPVPVTVAVIHQTNYLAAGEDQTIDDLYKGITSLRIGGLSRTFDRSNHFLISGLCRRAYALMWRYRLTSGRIL